MQGDVCKKQVAVILSGCGNKDGSEITEAISLVIALSQANVQITFFAPDLNFLPLNFLTNVPLSEKRNVLIEAARISRGQIKDLKLLSVNEFDGLAIPGGYGAVMHLCDWANKGAVCTVNPFVEKSILSFYTQQKAIATICIAPVIVARVLGKHGVLLTIGNDDVTAEEIRKTGAHHELCSVSNHIVDRKHKILSTPAYMYSEAQPFEIFKGISGMVKEFVKLI